MLELLRPFRNMGWFIFGVLLVAVPMFAWAVDYPPTVLYRLSFSDIKYSSMQAACSSANAPSVGTCVYHSEPDASSFKCVCTGGTLGSSWPSGIKEKTCPQGGTIVGSMCVGATACPVGQTRDPVTGVCSGPSCKLGANAQAGSTRYAFPNPQPSGVTWCVNDCEVYPNAVGSNIVGSTRFAFALVNGAGGSASTCSAGASSPSAVADPTTSKTPPCAVGDGSLTTADGTVKCVPSTTPGATVPPIQSSSSSKQTFPDGSTTTTTTTNTCTGDGACSSTITTTNTANSAGTQGAAGPVGTGTQQQNKKGDQPSDFCAQNPSLQICKGGISEEATQKKILTEIESLTKPKFDDDSALKNAGKYEADQATKDLNEKDTLAATGGFDPIANNKTAMMQAMESGWFTPIPRSSCQPMGGQVGPYNWNFDLCPTAAKISEIGAYAMWFMLAWGTFLMVTGARREG